MLFLISLFNICAAVLKALCLSCAFGFLQGKLKTLAG
jgi:hypothetical protein